jgi:hypothetical protein
LDLFQSELQVRDCRGDQREEGRRDKPQVLVRLCNEKALFGAGTYDDSRSEWFGKIEGNVFLSSAVICFGNLPAFPELAPL